MVTHCRTLPDTNRARAVQEIEIETDTETSKINFTNNLSKISTMTNNLAIQGIFLYFLF
jgi:hypothetical protein